MRKWYGYAGAMVLVAALFGCSEEVDQGTRCGEGEVLNPVSGNCTVDTGTGGDSDSDSDGVGDGDGVGNGDGNGDGPGEIHSCGAGNPPTLLSGTVRIPSGELPLPGVSVYVPRNEPAPIETGAECRPCDSELREFDAVAHGTTNLSGDFLLSDVPAGTNIPLVIEVGKWRRQVVIPEIRACEHNIIDDLELTRLPRNSEEGDIPRFAVTTGEFDAMECLFRKIGIDDSEFSTEAGDGRVHLFAGRGGTDRFANTMNNGASFTRGWDWWDNLENLMEYDIVVHSCEGNAYLSDKSTQARQALLDFTESGGRAFLSHWHKVWLRDGPADFQSVATWMSQEAITGAGLEPEMGYIDNSFFKGQQLEDWMHLTGTEPRGEFPIRDTRGSIESINEAFAQQWIWIEPGEFELPGFPGLPPGLFPDPLDEMVQYFSFNTPVTAPEEDQCGRVVFSDIHVAAGDTSSVEHPFPNGCRNEALTPQEKALVFMLFDLSRCIISDKSSAGF